MGKFTLTASWGRAHRDAIDKDKDYASVSFFDAYDDALKKYEIAARSTGSIGSQQNALEAIERLGHKCKAILVIVEKKKDKDLKSAFSGYEQEIKNYRFTLLENIDDVVAKALEGLVTDFDDALRDARTTVSKLEEQFDAYHAEMRKVEAKQDKKLIEKLRSKWKGVNKSVNEALASASNRYNALSGFAVRGVATESAVKAAAKVAKAALNAVEKRADDAGYQQKQLD